MFKTHFMFPEQKWGVWKDGEYLGSFDTLEDAQAFIERLEDAA